MSVDGWSQEPEANVSVWGTYAGQQNQSCRHWRFVEVDNGIYEIIARHAGLYLEVADSSVSDGANVQINDYQSGAAHMQFRLIPAEEEERLDDGVYYIEEVQSGKVLAVANASTEQSASVISEEYTNSKAQHWIFRHQDNGFFTFDNELSNYLMCVGGWGTSPGDAVVVWGTEASHSQQTCRQWKLNKNDDGTYHIFGKHSELFLEVKDDNKVQINTLDEFRKMSFNIHKVGESLLNSTSASALTIYPNPCNDYLNAQLNGEYRGCYNIYNAMGMVVSKGVVSSPDFPGIDCTLLIPGHYYLEFITANNKKACHFIKI